MHEKNAWYCRWNIKCFVPSALIKSSDFLKSLWLLEISTCDTSKRSMRPMLYDAGFVVFQQLYVLCLFPLSGFLCGERVDGVVRLCRALQGHGPQAEQDHPAGAAQCRQTLPPSGGACRLCWVLDSWRPLSQLTWWVKSTWIPPYAKLMPIWSLHYSLTSSVFKD